MSSSLSETIDEIDFVVGVERFLSDSGKSIEFEVFSIEGFDGSDSSQDSIHSACAKSVVFGILFDQLRGHSLGDSDDESDKRDRSQDDEGKKPIPIEGQDETE